MKKYWIVIVMALGVSVSPAAAQTWDDVHAKHLLLPGGGTDLVHTLTLQAPALAVSSTLTLPGTNASGLLTNDGTGGLSWVALATAVIAPGTINTFLVTNGSVTVAWLGLSINSTLTGNGIGSTLGINLATANIWTATQTVKKDNITTTLTDGVVLQNTTPATLIVAVQQSPSLSFQSHVWNTTASGTDNTFNARETFIPASSLTPTARFSWTTSNNGGTYTERMSLTDAGVLTLGSPLSEANGGTNQNSYASGDILYASNVNTLNRLTIGSNGQVLNTMNGFPVWGSVDLSNSSAISNRLPALNGGTGIDGSTAANGRLLIGNGSGYTLASLTTDPAHPIVIDNPSQGSIRISLPQDIATTSNPAFIGMTLSGDLSFTGTASRTISVLAPGTSSAGSDLTVKAGIADALADLNGGNLNLASGPARGIGSSQINFQTVTGGQLTGTSVTTRPPTTIATLDGTGKLNFVAGGTRTISISAAATGANGNQLTLKSGNGTSSGGSTQNGGNILLGTGSGINAGHTDGDIVMQTGGTTRMTVSNSGSINIPGLTVSLPVRTDGSSNLTTGTISLTSGSADISGTLAAGNGGTGQSSYTTGDLLYASSSSALSKLGVGGANTVLHGGATPNYSAIANGDLSSSTIGLTNADGSLTITGSPISLGGSGTVTLALGHANIWTAAQTLAPTGSNVALTIAGSSSGNDVTGNSWSVTHAGAATFASIPTPGAIGGTTANTGAFTTLSAAPTGATVGLTITGTTSGNDVTGNGWSINHTGDATFHSIPTPGAIGSTTANTGAFTTLSATPTGSGVGLTIAGTSTGNDVTGTNWSVTHAGAATFASIPTPGAIGGTTANTGAFTSLTATPTGSGVGLTIAGTSTGNDVTGTNWSVTHAGAATFASIPTPGAIGGGTAAAGTFTTLSSTGAANINTSGAAATNLGTSTGTTAVGNSTGTTSITGSVWSVTTAGAATFASIPTPGAIGGTTAAAGTFTSVTATTGGLTATLGGITSHGNTTINTTASDGTTSIGNASNTLALTSSAFTVTTVGAVSGATTVTASTSISAPLYQGADVAAGTVTAFRAGNSSGANAGAAASVTAGNAGTTGAGGALTLAGGTGGGATGQAGGVVNVNGGAATTANSNGGAASVTGGAAFGTGTGGTATLAGGAAAATAASAGGAVSVAAAAGSTTGLGAAGGAVTIAAGDAKGTGNNLGGAVSVTAGAATGTDKNSGGVTIDAGSSTGLGASTISFKAAIPAAATGGGSNASVAVLQLIGDHLIAANGSSPALASNTANISAASCTGNDIAGTASIATSASGAIATATFNFNRAFAAAPIVLITPTGIVMGTSNVVAPYPFATSSATQFSINFRAGTGTIVFNYLIIGK